MTKVVINNNFGGFRLPGELQGLGPTYDDDWDRTCPILIAAVENANYCGDLCIVNVPDEVHWYIEEYDGLEYVAEVHRTWHGGVPASPKIGYAFYAGEVDK